MLISLFANILANSVQFILSDIFRNGIKENQEAYFELFKNL